MQTFKIGTFKRQASPCLQTPVVESTAGTAVGEAPTLRLTANNVLALSLKLTQVTDRAEREGWTPYGGRARN
jgi:hypothetical protein